MRPFVQLALAVAMTIVVLPASAQDDPTAYMVTYIEVVPTAKSQGTAILKALADASRKEAGVTRFEIFERTAPASQFLIVCSAASCMALNARATAPSSSSPSHSTLWRLPSSRLLSIAVAIRPSGLPM